MAARIMGMAVGVSDEDFLALARLALSARGQEVALFLQRSTRRLRQSNPTVSEQLTELLRSFGSQSSAIRRVHAAPTPVDADSRLQLVRSEPNELAEEPILNNATKIEVKQIIAEHQSASKLAETGLYPARTALFVGPPGVGKTMTARWIASELHKPLLVLDLSAVMSSLLGKTGSNIRSVMDYAKNSDSILLLDELDAIAKRRDDSSEIGELKRLVTVLLQEIDSWPGGQLLLAATNHSELLDPAIWRRFDNIVKFEVPGEFELIQTLRMYFDEVDPIPSYWEKVLSGLFVGWSFSDLERFALGLRKRIIVNETNIDAELQKYVTESLLKMPRQERVSSAEHMLFYSGLSQRTVSEITGISRDTLRKMKTPENTKSL